jgi:hypothetical protein
MPRVIRSLAARPVVVNLNGGAAVRLSPGQASGELPDAEVDGNPKVDKLREQRLITVEAVALPRSEPAQREAAEPSESGVDDTRTRATRKGSA